MFFGGGKRKLAEDLGVLLDIENSEVTIAIAISDAGHDPRVLWSHKEAVPIGEPGLLDRRLFVAIQTAFTELSNNGLPSLRRADHSALPSVIQVSLAAPFAYTVGRNVSLRDNKPFRVTRKLVKELEQKAVEEVRSQAASELFSKNLKLVALSDSTAALSVNGYPTYYPFKSSATELTLCQVVAIGQSDLVEHIQRCQEKILPGALLDIDSFMSLYLRVVTELAPKANDMCLVSVSERTTELLTQRDGLPQSSVFIPFGHEDHLPAGADGQASYEESLTKLFVRYNDGLSLPKNIYLLSEKPAEHKTAEALQRASRKATGTNHQIFSVPAAFFSRLNVPDARLCSLVFAYGWKLYEDRHLTELEDMIK